MPPEIEDEIYCARFKVLHAHVSDITCMDINSSTDKLISGGSDLVLWNLTTNTKEKSYVIPSHILRQIRTVKFHGGENFFSGGDCEDKDFAILYWSIDKVSFIGQYRTFSSGSIYALTLAEANEMVGYSLSIS